jgi:hypothetical protein
VVASEDPSSRPELVALIDLTSAQAAEVCAAMENVGLAPTTWTLGTGADDTGIARAMVRIYIPRTQLRDARAVVQGVLPEYGSPTATPHTLPTDEEKAWADIVRELRAEGVEEPAAQPARSHPEDSEPGYQPPQPPPFPKPSRGALLSLLLLIGGLGYAVVSVANDSGRTSVLLGIGLFAIGFGGLIWRIRDERDDYDDDDGAIV